MNNQNSHTILIVNDSPDQMDLLKFILRQAEYNVLTASSGNEGFEIVRRTIPDLIVSKVIMPDGDGIELCRRLHADEKSRALPVLLISGLREDTASVTEALESGADDYLEAPFDPVHLVARVARLIEQVKAKTALRESENKFRTVLEYSRDIIYQINLETKTFDYMSLAAKGISGYEAEEFIEGGFAFSNSLVHPEDLPPLKKQIAETLLANRTENEPVEYRLLTREKGYRWVSESRTVVRGERGEPVSIIAIARDITAQKQTESALIEANERAIRQYNNLLQRLATLGETVSVARDLNAVFSAVLDFTRASAPCSALVISLYDEKSKMRKVTYCWYNGNEMNTSGLKAVPVGEGVVGQAIKTGNVAINNDYLNTIEKRGVKVSFGFDEDTRNPQSSIIAPMKIKGVCVGVIEVQSYDLGAYKDEHGTAMSMAANFIANAIENVRLLKLERQREEQLRQSQKLESVGRLAGGIAHDFNNMLTAINGYSNLTLRRLPPDDPLRHNIEEIRKAGERSASLTHQLLAFSRQQVLKPKVLDINQTVNDISAMLKRLIGEDVQLIAALSSELGHVEVDPGQLSQVIMNLAVNARDAMPKGGTLTIETSNVLLDEEFAARHVPTQAGHYVMMAVSDTGTGIAPETRKHIFEPFFTTKEVGKGTGLGLATVYGIVKQSGGYIWVESELERGTTFKIYLPRVDRLFASEKKQTSLEEMEIGTETVLLVEDERMVRELSRHVLQDCGYTVIEANNGVEALEICKTKDCRIDLLMTDVVMPQMGGRELAEKLTVKLPHIKVLFTSGYTDDSTLRRGVIKVGTNFIQKPYSPTALALKVRRILDTNK